MDRNLRQFEGMIEDGQAPSPQLQQRMQRSRGTVDRMKRMGGTPGDMKDIDMNQLSDDMQSMEEERRMRQQEQRQLQMLQRGIRGAEQGLRGFELQVTRLTRQKLSVPSELTEKLTKAKEIIAAVKSAKTLEEAQSAGLEDLQGVMEEINESHQILEFLVRWPQILKQVDRQLKQLQQEVRRSKLMVDRLLKKDIDLSSTYNAFVAAVDKLKVVRDEAAAKAVAGEAGEAMQLLEDDFFSQFDDVMEHRRVIETMNNLGRFAGDFKRGIAEAQRQIRQVERKKLNASSLKELLAAAQVKGAEILAALKGGDFDEEVVMSAMQELEDIRQQFQEKFEELMGIEDQLPWEKGPDQFKTLQLSPEINRFISR